jgi:hypothetical protein
MTSDRHLIHCNFAGRKVLRLFFHSDPRGRNVVGIGYKLCVQP